MRSSGRSWLQRGREKEDEALDPLRSLGRLVDICRQRMTTGNGGGGGVRIRKMLQKFGG